MSTLDNTADIDCLRRWQRERLSAYEANPPTFRNGPAGVTVVTYFFRPEEAAADRFPYTKCAILETWRHCGTIKTVIVSHALMKPVAEFANQFSDLVEVQVEPALKPLPPGDVASMSVDCISKLHERFSTPQALIVQDDGFPLRPGLDEFLGKWDYVGAPWPRQTDWTMRLLTKTSNLVGNGGFSLRSRAICREASRLWKAGWKHLPSCPLVSEDVFYAQFLPRWSRSYRNKFRFAPVEVAAQFSVEWTPLPGALPFGFHAASAFRRLEKFRQREVLSTPNRIARAPGVC